MANQVPQNEQGELQGINASVGSIAAIIGPLLMTQSFAWFTAPDTPLYFPGIAFLSAGTLTVLAMLIFAVNVRVLNPSARTTQG
jgi:DHA1 family tetracycline resistance protein-like MFS transporter